MSDWREQKSIPGLDYSIGVVGHNVDLSLTVSVLQCGLDVLGKNARVLPFDIPKAEFEECVQHLNGVGFRGMSVSNPHKVDAARIANRFWISKFALGTANALSFQSGVFAQNTEVPAIGRCVAGITPQTALVLGTGHAARSVVAGLLEAGWGVKIWNRNRNKTSVLITLLSRYGSVVMSPEPDPSGCSLVVNATPLGSKAGEQPPLQWNRVLPKTVFFDLVYRRVATEFLRAATLRGLRTIDGRALVVEQSALALEWWTEAQIPRQPLMLAAGLKG